MINKSINFADDDVDPREVDNMLAKELTKLSFNSRESIHEEMHGVRCLAPKETPKLLEIALEKLSLAIDNIPCAEKQAFLQSQELFPNNRFVNDKNFRLMFLRSELFDARRAAIRLVKYLDFLLEIFNNKKELLGRPIRLDDLRPRAMKLLRSGRVQLLPVRDNSGRRVLVFTSFKTFYSVIDRLQVYSYFLKVLCEEVDNQRTGVVIVGIPNENFNVTKFPPKEDRYKLSRYLLSAPIRCCANHCCYSDTPFLRVLIAMYALGYHTNTSESSQFRFKFHSGMFHDFFTFFN